MKKFEIMKRIKKSPSAMFKIADEAYAVGNAHIDLKKL